MSFLPVNRDDLDKKSWSQLDIIIVSGDAYVDHPAWAAALLGRFMESRGFRVGVIAQPDWNNPDAIKILGAPRLFFAVSAGNLDSMVNHYTADRKKRKQDVYSPGGRAGMRPDRATIVYCNLIRQAFPGVPIVVGGIEASLRRIAHYDYWSNSIRRSILLDSKADLLVYGMGEYPLWEIARRLDLGQKVREITDVRGTCYWTKDLPPGAIEIPSFEEIRDNHQAFVRATRMTYLENNPYNARILAQQHQGRWVVQNPPAFPLTTPQLDEIYEFDFQRQSHPDYDVRQGVPALAPVQFSLTSHRGCFGGCSFCSLGLHQGKYIQNRSLASLKKEASRLTRHPDFKGTISDVGGPSANMYGLKGVDRSMCATCKKTSCLCPTRCPNLKTDHRRNVELLRRLRDLPGVKHLFVSSGIRYDLVLQDTSGNYLPELCQHHVGGQLKIAPEHVAAGATRCMNKPPAADYRRFSQLFKDFSRKAGKNQYLIPYFISGHPGCRLEDNVELAEHIRDELHFQPEQVQNFTPLPMTLSACMYVTGIDPFSGREIYVPRDEKERKLQRALLQYREPNNLPLVLEALQSCGRQDLIGSHPRALAAGKRNDCSERSSGLMSNTKKEGPKNKKSTGPKRKGWRPRS
ncbi:MAG TPA: YgiQ family radical SAM protein [Syntrophomonadaceae bacterium]|nr:YgiQ family radical SAM protein [Syntrophomonadaceae bacterium]